MEGIQTVVDGEGEGVQWLSNSLLTACPEWPERI